MISSLLLRQVPVYENEASCGHFFEEPVFGSSSFHCFTKLILSCVAHSTGQVAAKLDNNNSYSFLLATESTDMCKEQQGLKILLCLCLFKVPPDVAWYEGVVHCFFCQFALVAVIHFKVDMISQTTWKCATHFQLPDCIWLLPRNAL